MEHVDNLFGIILPYANFVIFLGLAIYFFRKPARASALGKKDAYEKLLAEASAAKDAALSRLAEVNRRHQALDKEIAELRAISSESAELEAAKIIADAESLAAHLKHEAKRIADAEVGKARALLQRDIVEAVHKAVTDKISKEMSAATQHVLVGNRIQELSSLHADR